MHIPDGFLSTPVWVTTDLIALGGLIYVFKKSKTILKEANTSLIGVMAAFVFAAQMFNFPILAGTSGHLLGGALLAIVLGPYIGSLVLSIVLIVQCLFFQDGGLLALGSNIINMAFIGVWGAYFTYTLVNKYLKNYTLAVSLASFISVVLAALFCTVELALSGTVPFFIAILPMIGVHTLIGIGEMLITTSILTFITKVKPELILQKGSNYA